MARRRELLPLPLHEEDALGLAALEEGVAQRRDVAVGRVRRAAMIHELQADAHVANDLLDLLDLERHALLGGVAHREHQRVLPFAEDRPRARLAPVRPPPHVALHQPVWGASDAVRDHGRVVPAPLGHRARRDPVLLKDEVIRVSKLVDRQLLLPDHLADRADVRKGVAPVRRLRLHHQLRAARLLAERRLADGRALLRSAAFRLHALRQL